MGLVDEGGEVPDVLVVLGAAGLVGEGGVDEGAVDPAAGGEVVVEGAEVAEHLGAVGAHGIGEEDQD